MAVTASSAEALVNAITQAYIFSANTANVNTGSVNTENAQYTGVIGWLVTVAQTYGSSPRPAGSMMFWSKRTGVIGSVSGGCIEEDILHKIREGVIHSHKISWLTYGGQAPDLERFNLPCGGQLKVIIEPLKNTTVEKSKWQALNDALNKREGIMRKLRIDTGQWSWVLSNAFALTLNNDELRLYAGPIRKLLIVGANPTALYLAQFACALDFKVTVCDPGEDASSDWLQAPHCQFIKAYPDGFVAKDFGDKASAVVAVSHDPRIDDMALLEALPSEAFYVGAMGSQVTSQKRRDRLTLLGLAEPDLHKLHAPIGLDIGSKTPSEIAMSIAAHLVSEYNLAFKQRPTSVVPEPCNKDALCLL